MNAAARIDWSEGRIVGWAVPAAGDEACAVVEVCLDGAAVHRVVADRPVLPLRAALAELPLPPREEAAFALRLPQARLRPGLLQAEGAIRLSLRRSGEAPFFEATLQGARELAQLSEPLAADQRHEVRFTGLADGAVLCGTVRNRFGAGRPALQARANGGASQPLALTAADDEGRLHTFEVPLAGLALAEGHNLIDVLSAEGQPLAGYPLHIGPASVGDTERRLAAVETQLAFLKHLVLQQDDGQGSQLAQLKADLVRLCSQMLALQRANLEREWAAALGTRRAP